LDRRKRFSSYFWCGVAGGIAGIIVIVALAVLREGARPSAWLAIGIPIPVFFVSIKIAHIFAGHERIVFYEKFLAMLAATALALVLTDRPVWPGVELATIGIMTALALGRLGCLRVGCCHGRPYHWGIAYADEHVAAGFPRTTPACSCSRCSWSRRCLPP